VGGRALEQPLRRVPDEPSTRAQQLCELLGRDGNLADAFAVSPQRSLADM
jgi:hypothetical protein